MNKFSMVVTQITQKQVTSFFPPRPSNSHKGQFGRVAVIGGSTGMIGAALLAGRAALKLGAGCVYVGLLADNAPGVDPQQAELMLQPAHATLRLPGLDVIVMGCGMGQGLAAQKLLHDALALPTPLILDADALNLLATRPDFRAQLLTRTAPTLLTPHPGEAARLLSLSIEEVQATRTECALALAQRTHCYVVLKGAGSLCVSPQGALWINTTGNPGMSSPGMGDVLAGMLGAFISQGLPAEQALLLAVHLHGAAGDALAEQKALIGMTASEVTEWARWLLNQWV